MDFKPAAGLLALALVTRVSAQQTESDGYSRYELLAPGTSKFRILYEVTATSPGALYYFNPIRAGSVATDERVFDRASGKPLKWEVVGGSVAAGAGLKVGDAASQFIRVALAGPVPSDGGEARVLIDKTYEDPKSYFTDGNTIVFDRSLGVKRNAVLLPKGYELVSSNYPAQVLREADGRALISFWNATPAAAPVRIVARPATRANLPQTKPEQERARQSREIVYYLNEPSTHSFALTHDFTETRPGTSRYVNAVRRGSRVSNPSGRILDTGEVVRAEVLRGEKARAASPDAAELGADGEALVFHFRPVGAGESLRLRIAETYTDPSGYKLEPDGTLLWRRTLGRASNAVVLPAGWVLTSSTTPCVVETLNDGRIRLEFVNPRPDQLDVTIIAHRAQP